MSTGTILIVIVAAVAVLLVIWGIVTHNSLIARRNLSGSAGAASAWS